MDCFCIRRLLPDCCYPSGGRDNDYGPPGASELNCPTIKTVVGSPIVKNLAGATIAAGTGVIMGCPVLAGVLISLGVASSWLGGAGIIIAAVGVSLWLLSTGVSTKQLDDDESILFHLAASVFNATIGLLAVMVSAICHKTRHCCCGVENYRYDTSDWSTASCSKPAATQRLAHAAPDAIDYPGVSLQLGDGDSARHRESFESHSSQESGTDSGSRSRLDEDDDNSTYEARPAVRSASQDSLESDCSTPRRNWPDNGSDATPSDPVLQPTVQTAPTAPTLQIAATLQTPPPV